MACLDAVEVLTAKYNDDQKNFAYKMANKVFTSIEMCNKPAIKGYDYKILSMINVLNRFLGLQN